MRHPHVRLSGRKLRRRLARLVARRRARADRAWLREFPARPALTDAERIATLERRVFVLSLWLAWAVVMMGFLAGVAWIERGHRG